MDAKNLMIGDWVKLSKGNWSENRQVELIDIEMIAEGVYLAEPIPLTVEILEKNGFEKEWDEDVMLMACDTIIVEIGDNYKLYKDGKMYLRRVLAPLYYVHQLQHALRLCGIEKEIII